MAQKKHPHATPVLIQAIINNSEGNPDKLTEDDKLAIKSFLTHYWDTEADHPEIFHLIAKYFIDLYSEWEDEMIQIAVNFLTSE